MKIAILGWGSLIWSPDTLQVERHEWYPDGPPLPLEFARIARDKRLTLALMEGAQTSHALWNLSCLSDLHGAQQNLFERESHGKPFDADNSVVGFIDLHSAAKQCRAAPSIEPVVRKWAADKNLDAVLWTDLPANFAVKTKMELTADNVIAHLNGLDREAREYAEEYILRTPKQISTRIRQGIQDRIKANYESEGHTKALPPVVHNTGEPAEKARLTLVSKLSARLLHLQSLLSAVQHGDRVLTENDGYIQCTTGRITELLDSIPAEANEGREILGDDWQQITECPLMKCPGDKFAPADQMRHLATLDTLLDDMIFLTAYITIPPRLIQWLKHGDQGYYIPFHEVFKDELPKLEARVRLLNLLKWAPKEIEENGGLVDAESGLIYWYSTDSEKQRNSWLRVAAIFIVMLALVLLSGLPAPTIGAYSLAIPNWAVTNPALLGAGWLAVLIGILVHGAVSTFKLGKTSGRPPILAPGDLSKWINAHEGDVITNLLLSFFVFFALAFILGISQVQVGNAFLVGYSFDSVFELLGTTLDQRANSLLTTLKGAGAATKT